LPGEGSSLSRSLRAPASIAKVTATVKIRPPAVTRHHVEPLTFLDRIPLEIDMDDRPKDPTAPGSWCSV